jgi:hypothetical protein
LARRGGVGAQLVFERGQRADVMHAPLLARFLSALICHLLVELALRRTRRGVRDEEEMNYTLS